MKTLYSDIDRFTLFISDELDLFYSFSVRDRDLIIYCLEAPFELIRLPLSEIVGEKYSEAVEKVEVALAMRQLLQ